MPPPDRIPTFGIRTASDLFGKLERDARHLEEEVSSDYFFNFVVTAYHLAEWIDQDRPASPTATGRLNALRESHNFKLCRDLANACKHFALRSRTVLISSHSARGYGVGRYGRGGYGVGEEEITLESENGGINALDFAREIVTAYRGVLEEPEGAV